MVVWGSFLGIMETVSAGNDDTADVTVSRLIRSLWYINELILALVDQAYVVIQRKTIAFELSVLDAYVCAFSRGIRSGDGSNRSVIGNDMSFYNYHSKRTGHGKAVQHVHMFYLVCIY